MKTTLQTRLIILMVLASIVFIGVFTAIQVNNQIQRTYELTIHKARQDALSVKGALEDIFSTVEPGQPRIASTNQVKKAFMAALEMGTIETAILMDTEGKPVVLEGNLKLVFEDEAASLSEISKIRESGQWLVPQLDEEFKLASLFISVENPYGYVAKLTFSMGELREALSEVYGPIAFTIIIVVVANIVLAGLLSQVLIAPIRLLNAATKDIAKGNFEKQVSIKTHDELEELATTFNYMTVELRKMKERAENANPLTKLPGNIVIREMVEDQIRRDKKFVLIYSDLDDFKAFNDRYGLDAGDKVIMLTATILKEAVAAEGTEDDFVGHEGGDDFLLLTVPDKAEAIATYIIKEFDRRIREFYPPEDLERGYIEAKSRHGDEVTRFPIMTISLAGVTNLGKKITSYAQITNVAAEIKRYLKKHKKSLYLLDRRRIDLGFEFRGKGQSSGT